VEFNQIQELAKQIQKLAKQIQDLTGIDRPDAEIIFRGTYHRNIEIEERTFNESDISILAKKRIS